MNGWIGKRVAGGRPSHKPGEGRMLRVAGEFLAEGNGRVFKVYAIEYVHHTRDGREDASGPTLMTREGYFLEPADVPGAYFVEPIGVMVRRVDN